MLELDDNKIKNIIAEKYNCSVLNIDLKEKTDKEGYKYISAIIDEDEDKSTFPYFKGLHPNSTTVSAYCSNCGASIRSHLQHKCDSCGYILHWDIIRKKV